MTVTQKLVKLKTKLLLTGHDHDKYITTQELNKLTLENFAARLTQTYLASKNDIANFIKKERFK